MALHCKIIYVALYGLAYMRAEDYIHYPLIYRPYVLQAKGHNGENHIPSGVLKDVYFSSSGYILI